MTKLLFLYIIHVRMYPNVIAFTVEILFKEFFPALSHRNIHLHFLLVTLWFYLSHFYQVFGRPSRRQCRKSGGMPSRKVFGGDIVLCARRSWPAQAWEVRLWGRGQRAWLGAGRPGHRPENPRVTAAVPSLCGASSLQCHSQSLMGSWGSPEPTGTA